MNNKSESPAIYSMIAGNQTNSNHNRVSYSLYDHIIKLDRMVKMGASKKKPIKPSELTEEIARVALLTLRGGRA